jgi:hypothetical protein
MIYSLLGAEELCHLALVTKVFFGFGFRFVICSFLSVFGPGSFV